MILIDEEKKIDQKIRQSIHTTLGHLIKEVRLMSPLSHNEMWTLSSIAPSTTHSLENKTNYSAHSYAEIFFYHLRALKCAFSLHHLCIQIREALANGKCLIVVAVDFSELSAYDKHSIILRQQSDDKDELERRKRQKQETLWLNQKKKKVEYKTKAEKPAKTRKKTKKK